MLIEIEYTYVPRTQKWIITVLQNKMLLALILRDTSAECERWIKKNAILYASGKTPTYGG